MALEQLGHGHVVLLLNSLIIPHPRHDRIGCRVTAPLSPLRIAGSLPAIRLNAKRSLGKSAHLRNIN